MFSAYLYVCSDYTGPWQQLTLAIFCSIVYEKGSKKESFEWYNIRKRKEKECKVVAGDKKEEGSKPPTSVPKEHVANGYAKFRQNAQKTGEHIVLAQSSPGHFMWRTAAWAGRRPEFTHASDRVESVQFHTTSCSRRAQTVLPWAQQRCC